LSDDSAKAVKERLKTIATKYRKTKGFCTMKIGVDPLVVSKLINEVAQMTNMPLHLQNILESTIKVMDAGSSMAKNEPFASDGMVHYILIAAYRNGKISNTNKLLVSEMATIYNNLLLYASKTAHFHGE
jgi:hypothetical protein